MSNTHFNHPDIDYDENCVACLQSRVAELDAEAVLRKRDHEKDRAERNTYKTFVSNLASWVGGDMGDLAGLHSLLKAKLGINSTTPSIT